MDTQAIIIEQLRQGKEEAYEYLYRHHYAVLCHVAFEYINDRYQAEALVGDVIFHLWEIHEKLQIQTSLRSYLVQAVRNRCLDYLSSRWEKNEVAFSTLDEDRPMEERYVLSDSYPLGRLLEQELEEAIKRAIAALPADCRKVFKKSRFEGKKYEEIASELGISVNTVKYHIKNALLQLRGRLEKYMLLLSFLFFSQK